MLELNELECLQVGGGDGIVLSPDPTPLGGLAGPWWPFPPTLPENDWS